MTLIAFYNFMYYVGVIGGFYLNGKLLRKYVSPRLYVIGLLFMGVSIASLTLFNAIDLSIILIFGLLYGIGGGIYWGNRNLLTLKTTQSENRIYFSSLESTFGTFTDIIIPFLIGMFIVFGSNIHLYTPVQAYQLLSISILIVVVAIWFVIAHMQNIVPPVQEVFLSKPSNAWENFRLFEGVLGFIWGLDAFLPTLMVLVLVGKENTLGIFQSVTAIITAFAVYTLGKQFHIKNRPLLLRLSFLISIVGAVTFSLFYSTLGVFIFYITIAVAQPFQWIAVNSLNYDLIDKEDKSESKAYAYIFDQDIFLCVGRGVSILLFIFLVRIFSNEVALRFTPLLLAISQIFLLPIAKLIEHKLSSTNKLTGPGVNLNMND